MKLCETAAQHADIEATLNKYEITNYIIHLDGTVDVDGDVNFFDSKFHTLPVRFGKVSGYFSCYNCERLTTLDGLPSSIGRNLNLNFCLSLENLDKLPESVGGFFEFSHCPKITSLEGLDLKVNGTIHFSAVNITRGGIGLILTGCARLLSPNGAAGPFNIIEKYLGRPDDIFECQAELIEAGYEAYAQL